MPPLPEPQQKVPARPKPQLAIGPPPVPGPAYERGELAPVGFGVRADQLADLLDVLIAENSPSESNRVGLRGLCTAPGHGDTVPRERRSRQRIRISHWGNELRPLEPRGADLRHAAWGTPESFQGRGRRQRGLFTADASAARPSRARRGPAFPAPVRARRQPPPRHPRPKKLSKPLLSRVKRKRSENMTEP